jgi:hypothetical protein
MLILMMWRCAMKRILVGVLLSLGLVVTVYPAAAPVAAAGALSPEELFEQKLGTVAFNTKQEAEEAGYSFSGANNFKSFELVVVPRRAGHYEYGMIGVVRRDNNLRVELGGDIQKTLPKEMIGKSSRPEYMPETSAAASASAPAVAQQKVAVPGGAGALAPR